MHELALPVMEREFGPDSADVTYVLTDLAKVLMELGDFEALKLEGG